MATIENFIVRIAAQGVEKLDAISNKADAASRKLDQLSSAMLGVGFAAFIKGALDAADRIADLSDATGLSIGNIVAFEKALDAAGGKARNAEKIITGFYQAIETANDGSLKARDAFAAVGVSLDMLKNASEADILSTTLRGLSKMKEGSERTALATTLLTKAFRGVDPAAFNRALESGNFQELEETIKRNAEMAQKLEAAYKNLQIGALKAIEPILKLFGEQNLTIEAAEKIVTALGVAFAITFGAKTIGAVIELASGVKKLTTAMVELEAASVIAGGRLAGVLALATKVGTVLGLLTFSSDLNKGEDEWLAKNRKLQDALKELPKAQQEAYFKLKQEDQKRVQDLILNGKTAEQAMASLGGGKPGTSTGNANRSQQQDPRQKAVEESKKRILQSEAEISKFQILMAGNTADEIKAIQENANADIVKAHAEIFGREYLNNEQKENEFAAKRKEINAKTDLEIKKIRDELNNQLKEQLDTLKQTAEQKQAEFDIEKKFAALGPDRVSLEKELLAIEERRKKAIEDAAKLKNMDPGLLAQQIDGINAVAEAEANRANAMYEYQRSFEKGWTDAYANFVSNGTNAAKIAGDMFNSVTNNMMGALDRFVETGKLNFSDLARSIILDLMKIQLRAAAVQLFQASGIGSLFGLPGKAIGGPVMANQPYIVGERGPELLIPNSAGTIIPNNKLGGGSMGGNTYITNNISAVDAKSVAQLFAENRMTLFGTVEQARRELPLRTR